jgi:GxxExxY protein
MNAAEINVRSGQVVDAALQVHSALGPGLLEGAYEACLAYELRSRGLRVLVQSPLPIAYKGVHIELGYRADLVVDDAVIVELKSVTKLMPIHEAQLLSYLKLSGHRVGLLINFHVPHLKDGIKRLAMPPPRTPARCCDVPGSSGGLDG